MVIYELIVDYDMTTSSSPVSEGLFSSRNKAEKSRDNLQLKNWQWSEIKERQVS